MKRLVYLLLIIAVVVLVIVLGYLFRYRPGEAPEPRKEGGTQGGGGLPNGEFTIQTSTGPLGPEGEGAVGPLYSPGSRFGVISNTPVLNYYIDRNGAVTIVAPDGKIVRVARGEETTLNEPLGSAVVAASFSWNGEKILINTRGGEKPGFRVFDTKTKTLTLLDSKISSASWSPNDNNIAYIIKRNDVGAIEIINLDAGDGAKPKQIITLRIEDVELLWADTSKLLLTSKPSAYAEGGVWAVDLNKKTITRLTAGFGLTVLWNRHFDRGLMFTSNPSGRGGKLVLIDGKGAPLKEVRLPTLPEKCVFDRVSVSESKGAATSSLANLVEFLYCAIPKDDFILRSSLLPDSYEMGAFFTADSLFRTDISDPNGATEVIDETLPDLDAIRLTADGNRLFFINKYDRKLYAYEIPSE